MVWVWIIANLSAHGLACLAWHSCNQWYTDKVHYLRIFLELYYVLISQALSVCFLNLYLFGFISVCQQSPTLEYLTLKIKANPNVHKETGTHLRTKKQTIDFNSQTKSQALFESCTCGLHCFPAISCHSIRWGWEVRQLSGNRSSWRQAIVSVNLSVCCWVWIYLFQRRLWCHLNCSFL